MLDKIEKLSKVLNESYSEKTLRASLGTFFAKNLGIDKFSINIEGKYTQEEHFNFKFPMFKHKKCIGFLEFDKETEDLNSFLEIATPFISLKIQNIIMSEKMQKNIDFHETMKNIAKIIETQYERNSNYW